MQRKVLRLVVEGREVVVAERFGQAETLKNRRLFRGEPRALGHGALPGVVGVQLDEVELGGHLHQTAGRHLGRGELLISLGHYQGV